MVKGHIHLEVKWYLEIDFSVIGGCARQASGIACRWFRNSVTHARTLVKATICRWPSKLKNHAQSGAIMLGLRFETVRIHRFAKMSRLLRFPLAAFASLLVAETIGVLLGLEIEYRAALFAAVYKDVSNVLP